MLHCSCIVPEQWGADLWAERITHRYATLRADTRVRPYNGPSTFFRVLWLFVVHSPPLRPSVFPLRLCGETGQSRKVVGAERAVIGAAVAAAALESGVRSRRGRGLPCPAFPTAPCLRAPPAGRVARTSQRDSRGGAYSSARKDCGS